MDDNNLSIDDVKAISPDGGYTQTVLINFIKYYGIENITPELLNEFEKHFSNQMLFGQETFWKFYKKAMDNENAKRSKKTNKTILIWTWVVGVTTLISAIFSILAYFKPTP